ncbi:hypothetical protein LCGC14_2202430, partial [marine sediment metagenome]
RNVFPDNIYVCNVPGHESKVGKCVSPAYTREWFQVTGIVSPHVYSDRFLSFVAGALGRLLFTPLIGSIQFTHEEENKIPRPQISSTKGALLHVLRKRVGQYVPRFREAISNHALGITTVQGPKAESGYTEPPEKYYPPGTKVGPGYTE